MKLEGHPQKDAILEALEQRRLGRLDAFFENFLTELAVTGEEPGFGCWPCRINTCWFSIALLAHLLSCTLSLHT
jgi:hypothetical protein